MSVTIPDVLHEGKSKLALIMFQLTNRNVYITSTAIYANYNLTPWDKALGSMIEIQLNLNNISTATGAHKTQA